MVHLHKLRREIPVDGDLPEEDHGSLVYGNLFIST